MKPHVQLVESGRSEEHQNTHLTKSFS